MSDANRWGGWTEGPTTDVWADDEKPPGHRCLWSVRWQGANVPAMPNPDEMTLPMTIAEIRDLADRGHMEAADYYSRFGDRMELIDWLPDLLGRWRQNYDEYLAPWDMPIAKVFIANWRPGFGKNPEIEESRRGSSGVMGVL